MTEQSTVQVRKTPQGQSQIGALLFHPGMLLGKIHRRMLSYYRKWFCQMNYIFEHAGPFSPENRAGCTFKCYASFDEIPEQVKADMCPPGDTSRLEIDKLELSENAKLWIALVDDRVASIVFTRKGKYFRRWFLVLQPEDIVVFRLLTHPEYRGRGLATSLIRHAIYTASDKPGKAYIDCRTYNKPSKRCIEKAGFKCIAIKKTIKREWALYD